MLTPMPLGDVPWEAVQTAEPFSSLPAVKTFTWPGHRVCTSNTRDKTRFQDVKGFRFGVPFE